MKPNKDQSPRRSFIKQLALLASALVLSRRPRRGEAAPLADESRPCAKGYRLTPHIRKYYELAAK